jgi:hypothetical protein
MAHLHPCISWRAPEAYWLLLNFLYAPAHTRYENASTLINAVDVIPFTTGNTYTSDGLNMVRTQLMTTANGLRPLSTGVARVVIVMTDGVATSGYVNASRARACVNIGVGGWVGGGYHMHEYASE